MAKIIWLGNRTWASIEDGNQPWDKEIENKTIPQNAKAFNRKDDIFKASIPYMILPCLLCFAAVFYKKSMTQSFIFDLRFIPVSFIIGFIFAMPLHELFHAICYPRDAKVYIGVCIKELKAFAASSASLTRERYILMSLAPSLLGFLSLIVFMLCPISLKWLLTICLVPAFMGLISPAPDYMDVVMLLREVPYGATIQPTKDGLVWYQ